MAVENIHVRIIHNVTLLCVDLHSHERRCNNVLMKTNIFSDVLDCIVKSGLD